MISAGPDVAIAGPRFSRTVRFRIDEFEKVGPVEIQCWTKPIEKGVNSEQVTPPFWVVDQDSFSITLQAKHDFPIAIGGHRYPMEIGRVQSRETRQMVEPDDKGTWPTVALLKGSKTCEQLGYCVHEKRGQEPCLRSINLTGGRVIDNDEVWVLRTDGPPVPESRLEETRKKEKVFRVENQKRIDYERGRMVPVGRMISPIAEHPANEGVAEG